MRPTMLPLGLDAAISATQRIPRRFTAAPVDCQDPIEQRRAKNSRPKTAKNYAQISSAQFDPRPIVRDIPVHQTDIAMNISADDR